MLVQGTKLTMPCSFCVSRVQPLGPSSGSCPFPQVWPWHPCSTLALPALQVVGVAHTFVEVWQAVAALLAELDVLLGFAELSVSAPTPYVRPQMLPADGGELVLVRDCAQPAQVVRSPHLVVGTHVVQELPVRAARLQCRLSFVLVDDCASRATKCPSMRV